LCYDKKPNYRCWWNLPALPKFNTNHPEVREMLFSVGEYWTRKGIDGWRLDVPNEIDDDSFWQEFRTRVKKINPEAYIVGEIWDPPARWLQGDQFDGVMNYPLRRRLIDFILRDEPKNNEAFCDFLNAYYPSDSFAISMNLLEVMILDELHRKNHIKQTF
jgi:glycosidase